MRTYPYFNETTENAQVISNENDTVEVVSEINLDKMSEPDTGFNTDESKNTNNFQTLPNVDAEIDKDLGIIKPDNKSNHSVDTFNNNTNNNTNPKTTDTSLPDYITKPFEDLRIKLGIDVKDFKMPEGLTKENYFDKLTETIYENTDFGDEGEKNTNLHPEIAKINELVKSGVSFEKAISEYNKFNDINNLEPKELVRLNLQQSFGKSETNPNGWDETKINSTLDKMEQSGYLELEAEKIKINHNNQKSQLADKLSKDHLDQVRINNEKLNVTRNEQIKKSLDYLNTLTDVYGMPLNKNEINEFAEDFRYMTTPDESGTAPLVRLLQSNENLVKIAYMLKKGDDKIRTSITEAKEKAKASIINKLDPEPQVQRKSSAGQETGTIDLEKLSAPEIIR